MNAEKDWWQEFFSGLVVEMWLQAVPEEQTRLEVDFIRRMLDVPPPGKLLDAPCGGGRHTIQLAAAGYNMTGVDQSAELLTAAESAAGRHSAVVSWARMDVRDLPWRQEFDGAFCFGNSFGYTDDAGNEQFLDAIYRTLKPGARFVLDFSFVMEARLPRFQERSWARIGDIFFLEDERYDPAQGCIITEYTLTRDGVTTTHRATQRTYTYRQIVEMLIRVGFMGIRGFGSLSEEPFQLGSGVLFLVASRPAA
jgi:SAM-dependent methyltransferase